jgi:hypothetical protein
MHAQVIRAILTAPGFRESRQNGSTADQSAPLCHVTESEITLGGIAVDTFDSLLDFVYYGRVVVPGFEKVLLLYKAADQLDVQSLRTACLEFVDMCLHSMNALGHGGSVELLLLADALNLDSVRTRCQDYIVSHLETVAVASPRAVWRLLPLSVMQDLMRPPGPALEEHTQEEVEVLLWAWAQWCGGAWAGLASLLCLSHASPPQPSIAGVSEPQVAPSASAAALEVGADGVAEGAQRKGQGNANVRRETERQRHGKEAQQSGQAVLVDDQPWGVADDAKLVLLQVRCTQTLRCVHGLCDTCTLHAHESAWCMRMSVHMTPPPPPRPSTLPPRTPPDPLRTPPAPPSTLYTHTRTHPDPVRPPLDPPDPPPPIPPPILPHPP